MRYYNVIYFTIIEDVKKAPDWHAGSDVRENIRVSLKCVRVPSAEGAIAGCMVAEGTVPPSTVRSSRTARRRRSSKASWTLCVAQRRCG
jgi:translation initiation factor IF-2